MFVALVDPVRRSQSTLIILPPAQPSQARLHLRRDRPTAVHLLSIRLQAPKVLTQRFYTASLLGPVALMTLRGVSRQFIIVCMYECVVFDSQPVLHAYADASVASRSKIRRQFSDFSDSLVSCTPECDCVSHREACSCSLCHDASGNRIFDVHQSTYIPAG